MTESSPREIDPLAIASYANGLIDILSVMGRLADTGVRADRCAHVEVQAEPVDGFEASRSRDTGDVRRNGGAGQLDAVELFRSWQDNCRQEGIQRPLLIVGMPGSGKSVLLEAIAFACAQDLLRWAETPTAMAMPPVPLPVRLRALRWERGEHERFGSFLVRSQRVLRLSRAGALPGRILMTLLEAGAVVPLLDGLDELPDSTAMGNIRQQVVDAARSTCGARYVVTARLGFDTEVHLSNCFRVYLRPLTGGQMLRYSAAVLNEPADAVHPAVLALGSSSSRISPALNHPLFLAAWCRRVATAPDRPPESLCELTDELYRYSFDHRRAVLPTSAAEQHGLRRALGSVLKVFADCGFGPVTRDDLDRRWDCDGVAGAESLDRLLQVAMAAGWLRHIGRSSYVAFRTPVTEYLIGRHLADLVLTQARHAQFLDTFRAWVWRPETHTILDYAVDALGSDPDGREVAFDLVRWLRCASAAEGFHGDGSEYGVDDLNRPLAFLALRFAALLPGGASEARAVARQAVRYINKASVYFDGLEHVLPAAVPRALVEAVVSEIVSLCSGEMEPTLLRQRHMQIWECARRVASIDAARLMHACLARLGADMPLSALRAWQAAMEAAASRLPHDVVGDIIEQIAAACARCATWRIRDDICGGRTALLEGWMAVAEKAGMAAGSMRGLRWIDECVERGRMVDHPESGAIWLAAAAGASGTVPVSDLRSHAEQLIERHLNAPERTEGCVWLAALERVLMHISEADADACVTTWGSRSEGLRERDRRASGVYSHAATIASRRMSASLAATLIDDFLADPHAVLLRTAEGMLATAASRLNADAADALTADLLNKCLSPDAPAYSVGLGLNVLRGAVHALRARKTVWFVRRLAALAATIDPLHLPDLGQLAETAGGRVPASWARVSMLAFLNRWIRETGRARGIWGFSMLGACRALPSRDVPLLVRRLISLYATMAAPPARADLLVMLKSAASRVGDRDAVAFIEGGLLAHDMTEQELEKAAWRAVITEAALQVPAVSRGQVCTWFIERGWHERAALVSIGASTLVAMSDRKSPAGPLLVVPRSRRDPSLLLDIRLAPSTILSRMESPSVQECREESVTSALGTVNDDRVISFGPLRIRPSAWVRSVGVPTLEVPLGENIEDRLFVVLATAQGKDVRRQHLENVLWPAGTVGTDKLVPNAVSKLREWLTRNGLDRFVKVPAAKRGYPRYRLELVSLAGKDEMVTGEDDTRTMR